VKIGAHVSSNGGIHQAIERAAAIGAECLQIFVSQPQGWQSPRHEDGEVALFRQKRAAAGLEPLFLHSIYLVNLGSPQPALYERSIRSLSHYMAWSERLGAVGVITHLGSSRGTHPREAEKAVCRALERILGPSDSRVALLLETSAGMGHSLGRRFEEMGRIMAALGHPPRLQACLDTAHIYAAGYDCASAAGLERTLAEFEHFVGLAKLTAVHANDSKVALGRGVDRHTNIGQGHIGEEGFRRILAHPSLRHLPFILEVPGFDGNGPDRENIAILRRLAERRE